MNEIRKRCLDYLAGRGGRGFVRQRTVRPTLGEHRGSRPRLSWASRTLLFLVALLGVPGIVLADYTITTTSGTTPLETIGYASNNSNKIAQDFKTNAGTPQTLSSITVEVFKSGGSPSDSLQFDVMGSDGSNFPDGVSQGVGTLAASSMTGSCADYVVTFSSPVTLSPSTVYWVQYKRTGAFDTANYYASCGVSPGVIDGNNFPFKSLRFDTSWTATDDNTQRLIVPIVTTVAPTATPGFGTLTFFGW